VVSRLTGRLRWLNAAAAGVCFAAIAYAVVWLQWWHGLVPCPLCVVDRAAFALAGLIFVVAALHAPRGRGERVYGAIALVPLAAGLGSAGRHVWLQHLPPGQVPACGPSLRYMLDNFPLAEAWQMLLRGSGSCAELHWQLLGLSIPEWTMLLFVILAVGAPAEAAVPRLLDGLA